MNILIELMTAVPLHGEMLECGNLRQFDVIEKQFPVPPMKSPSRNRRSLAQTSSLAKSLRAMEQNRHVEQQFRYSATTKSRWLDTLIQAIPG